jgi:hypothetical protein
VLAVAQQLPVPVLLLLLLQVPLPVLQPILQLQVLLLWRRPVQSPREYSPSQRQQHHVQCWSFEQKPLLHLQQTLACLCQAAHARRHPQLAPLGQQQQQQLLPVQCGVPPPPWPPQQRLHADVRAGLLLLLPLGWLPPCRLLPPCRPPAPPSASCAPRPCDDHQAWAGHLHWHELLLHKPCERPSQPWG